MNTGNTKTALQEQNEQLGKAQGPYRVTFGHFASNWAKFATFAEALAFERGQRGFSTTNIINDDRADGGKRQGLTEEEYEEWIG